MNPKNSFENAIKRTYRAVAFDIDGTLTPFSQFTIPETLKKTLCDVPQTVFKALCSGRDLKFMEKQLAEIISYAKNPQEELKKWTLFTENGAEGFIWNERHQKFEQFFEVDWPEMSVPQAELAQFLSKKGGFLNQVIQRPHTLVMRHHDWIYLFPKLTRFYSKKMHQKIERWITREGGLPYLQIQDSGIGNVILPALAGKGNAMRRWVERLDIQPKDLVVVGDQPDKGGNDHDFLSGEVGVAFTVGTWPRTQWPLPVLNSKGKRLKGPEGTEALLRQIKWSTLD